MGKKRRPIPVNYLAVENLDEEFIKENCIREDILERLYFIGCHGEDVKRAWNELWQEVKAE